MTETKYIINGNGKIAIVEAKVSENLLTVENFRAALTSALNNWCNFTPEGRAAWEASGHKFNIGDLTRADSYLTLKDHLMANYIADLRVTVESNPAATASVPKTKTEDDFFDDAPWEFDTVLITDVYAC